MRGIMCDICGLFDKRDIFYEFAPLGESAAKYIKPIYFCDECAIKVQEHIDMIQATNDFKPHINNVKAI